MKRVGRRDPRYHSRRWKETRLRILARDLWRCQIRGPHCRGGANQVDHIDSPHPDRGGASFFADSNLRAACGPCNNGRNAPGFVVQTRDQDDVPPFKRHSFEIADYTARKLTDGDSRR